MFVDTRNLKKLKKKVQLMENVKILMKAGMLCITDSNTFYLFTKSIWIEDSRALCHITNDNTSPFNIIDINELIHGSSGNIPATKKVKLASKTDKLMVLNGSVLYGP